MVEAMKAWQMLEVTTYWPEPEQVVFVLSLVLIVDHGVRHLRDRLHDWKGRWYRPIGMVILTAALVCYVAHFYGY